jgi:hypothetical protein
VCGRTSLTATPAELAEAFDLDEPPSLAPRYNIAPSQNVLTILERNSEREATFLRWGLIPFWSKEPKGFINARADNSATDMREILTYFSRHFFQWLSCIRSIRSSACRLRASRFGLDRLLIYKPNRTASYDAPES